MKNYMKIFSFITFQKKKLIAKALRITFDKIDLLDLLESMMELDI